MKIYCPECEQACSEQAAACPHCGHPLRAPTPNPTVIVQQTTKEWSPGVAAVLSFLIPGLGQIYKGHIFLGLVWLVAVVIGYMMFFVPGLVLHVLCIFGAAMGNPYRNTQP